MATPRFDVLGIGNAIVDVVARAGDDFLAQQRMAKGGMALIDTQAADAIYQAMPPGIESSGGSVANTCAVAAGLGARVAYLGKVADDQLGKVFRHDIIAAGVHFPSTPLIGGAPTARCLILVTPDAQRTMNTYLGACVTFGPADVDAETVAAFRRAAALAHKAGRQVALSLSDAFCVGRHRAAFRELVAGHVDILFANESEICSLYETADFDAAAEAARRDVKLAALTRSEAGSILLRGAETVPIAAAPTKVIDTTGAGDAYAAGFLMAFTAAAEVISQYGARPQGDLRALAARHGAKPRQS
jgi:sugar/nucleoside kinase (ribokinase family)